MFLNTYEDKRSQKPGRKDHSNKWKNREQKVLRRSVAEIRKQFRPAVQL
jgi:hypothetical protein